MKSTFTFMFSLSLIVSFAQTPNVAQADLVISPNKSTMNTRAHANTLRVTPPSYSNHDPCNHNKAGTCTWLETMIHDYASSVPQTNSRQAARTLRR